MDCKLVHQCSQLKAKLESEIQLGKAMQVQIVTDLDEFQLVHEERWQRSPRHFRMRGPYTQHIHDARFSAQRIDRPLPPGIGTLRRRFGSPFPRPPAVETTHRRFSCAPLPWSFGTTLQSLHTTVLLEPCRLSDGPLWPSSIPGWRAGKLPLRETPWAWRAEMDLVVCFSASVSVPRRSVPPDGRWRGGSGQRPAVARAP